MADLGLVARAGTALGEEPIPIDVVVPNSLGTAMAEAFRSSISGTTYFRDHFVGLGDIPRESLVEYSKAACLCRLEDHLAERNLIREALFLPRSASMDADARQRTLSFSLFLNSIRENSGAATKDSAFRAHVWDDFRSREGFSETRNRITSQWAALILKEYMQESLSTMWIHLCRAGLRNQPAEGFSPEQLKEFLRSEIAGGHTFLLGDAKIVCSPSVPMKEFNQQFSSAASRMSLEELRHWTREQELAVAGLAFLQVVCDRLPLREGISETDRAFLEVGIQRSMRQEGLLQIARALREHLETSPTVADTVEWALRRLVIDVHERVAYSKLPNFTFRFRWENGHLRFYNLGVWPFDLADMRHGSLSQISFDLGYWQSKDEGEGELTSDGIQFVAEAFA
jgi:hypothetical protein